MALLEAARSRVPVDPLTETYGPFGLDDAYGIQLLQVEARCAEGRRVKGHKVGLSSAAMQAQLGVDQPDFGHLLDDMFYAPHDGVPLSRFIQPRVEPEIAFVLGGDLEGPGVTYGEAARAVDCVLPALEVIDSRVRDWRITIADTVADNASSGGVVLGGTPRRLGADDLSLVGCNLSVDGRVVATGAGGAVLGDPLAALVWLANVLGARGVRLCAGEVILPGSLCASVPVGAGTDVVATFGGIGTVVAHFAAPEQGGE